MTPEQRIQLINYCVAARAELEDIDKSIIDREDFSSMSDEDLEKEADWLDDLLGK